jgi:hypothetical protein
MSKIDYAHPTTEDLWNDRQRCGITIRDYFAAAALQGLLVTRAHSSRHNLAESSFAMADAMLAARKEDQP